MVVIIASCGRSKSSMSESQAVDFLYKYMPLADSADYPKSFYEDNVKVTFQARQEMPWGKTVPDEIFKHFVLPLRVNNENLDTARVAFYRDLKDRVKDLSMEDAILEVNHWCHERVTFQPTDGRTSAPLATIKTSYGRCGEESTLTVSALRAVGIPARQIYTPRWAHTDDNHAWVEAWANGKWHFLGACEPEPVLDLAWFNSSASRALVMHSKVFGDYNGKEEVIRRGPNYTEINVTDNYTTTATVQVQVVGEDGKPVEGAEVFFMIYNYGEFYPAITKISDADGLASMKAGLGDMLAWARKDGLFGFSKITFGKDEKVQVQLSKKPSESLYSIDIVPPAEKVSLPEVTPDQRAANDKRLSYEDSLRNAYMATFDTPEKVATYGLPSGATAFLVDSKGNHEVIRAFLTNHPDDRALQLLASLSKKDLRDVTMDVLEDNYNAKESILAPRVGVEFLTPYKGFFLNELSEDQKNQLSDPKELVRWTKENIKVVDVQNGWDISMSPASVYKTKKAFKGSRDVFFISLARTLGIDARINPITGAVEYKDNGKWTGVDFEDVDKVDEPRGELKLKYNGYLESPNYYSHFTVSRILDGKPQLLTFDDGDVDMGGGASWVNFSDGVPLEVGDYVLVSGNRLSDGSVPVTMQFFSIEEGKPTTLELVTRESNDKLAVLGGFDAESIFNRDGNDVSILSQTGRGFYVLGVLEVGREPTNRALNDISKHKEELEKLGYPIVLLCSDDAALAQLNKALADGRIGQLPSNVIIGIDKNGSISKSINDSMNLKDSSNLTFLVADTFNKVYFVSKGYTIGIGDRLVEVLGKI